MHCSHLQPPNLPAPAAGRHSRPGAVVRERAAYHGVCRPLLLLLLLLAIVSPPKPVAAQRGRNPNWITFNTQLLASDVRAVLVDQDGSIWFGTRSGLNHFDGFWHNYTTVDGIPEGAVTSLTQAPDGTLWVGSDSGISRSERPQKDAPRTWTRAVPETIFEKVNVLLATETGQIWIGTDSGAGYIADDTWRQVLPESTDAAPVRIRSIAAISLDELWLGGDDLYRYNLTDGSLSKVEGFQARSPIQVILAAKLAAPASQSIWVGTAQGGLWTYDGQEWRSFLRPSGNFPAETVAANDILALAEDRDGTIWVGTNGGGVSLYNSDGLGPQFGGGFWKNFTTLDGLSANAVSAIALDNAGTAWIGTIGGASVFDTENWQTMRNSEDVASFTTALRDSTGAIWLGSEGSGLVRLDAKSLQQLTKEDNDLPDNYVRSLVEDGHGNLWIGTARFGLLVAPIIGMEDLSEARPAEWQQFTETELGSSLLRASAAASDGSLWFGTLKGLAHYIPLEAGSESEPTWEIFASKDGLISDEISQNALIIDSQDHIWIGTPLGISRYHPSSGQWRTYTAEDGLTVTRILSLAAAPAGTEMTTVWAGASDGSVYRYDSENDRWETTTREAAPVFALLATPNQNLWIGTAGGLRREDLNTGLSAFYQQEDGLVTNEIRTLVAGDPGTIWISTSAGISRHRPHSRVPKTQILTVNGKAPGIGPLDIPEGEPVAITFNAGDMVTPADHLRYRVWLEGVDDSWQNATGMQATYVDLEPGNYSLQVSSWNAALNLSEPVSLDFSVSPTMVLPFLGRVRTSAAYPILILLFLALAGVGASSFQAARGRQRRQQALKRQFNPYVSGEPVLNSDLFFGRDEILARILNTLHDNSIMIHGERRIGKTSLLHQIARHLRATKDPKYLFVPVYIDLEGTPEHLLFHAIMEEIVRILPDYLTSTPTLLFHTLPEEEYHDREFSRDTSDILKALSATTTKRIRVILLMDEMDVMNDFDAVIQQQLRRMFMRTFAGNLGAVVAGIQISKEWDRVESPWYNLFNEIEIGPIDEEAARRLILEPVRGIYKYEPEAVDFIIEESQSRPYYIQQHCLMSVNNMLADNRTRVLMEDVEKALDILNDARTLQQVGLPANVD